MNTDKRVMQSENYRERHKKVLAIRRAEKRAKRVIQPKAESPFANRVSPRSGVPAPKKWRWKPGHSGNPKGRPPRTASLTTLLKEELQKVCPFDKKGRTWNQRLVLSIMRQAVRGNKSAMSEIWNRADGRVLMPVGLTGGERPIVHVVYEEEEEDSRE